MTLQVTFRNLTDEPIVAQIHPRKRKETRAQLILQPSCLLNTKLAKGELSLHPHSHTITPTDKDASSVIFEKSLALEEGRLFDSAEVKISLSTTFRGPWNVVHASKWRILFFKITRRHRQIVILRHRNLASFLADMPDQVPLSSLLLPGSHDTMAFYGWPVAQCQSTSTPLSTQLHSGIRVLDIRLGVVPQPSSLQTTADTYKLIAYHGLWPQKTPFTSMLNDLFEFLSSPIGSRETIVMSIKQEDYNVTPGPLFSKLVRDTIIHGPGGWDKSKTDDDKGMWFLENRIPKLGEVRGKVILFSRFGGDGAGWENGLEGLGIHPTTWPDSEKNGFEWELKGTIVKTHDWYAIPSFLSIPEKVERATQNLIIPPTTVQPTLAITYFSAALFPLALPPIIAKGFGWPAWGLGVEGVNSKLGTWLLDKLDGGVPDAAEQGEEALDGDKRSSSPSMSGELRLRGWTLLDFYSESEVGNIVPLLVECNYRGRKEGKEGWLNSL